MSKSTDPRLSKTPKNRRLAWYKVGAVAYALWGLWHLQVVINLWRLGSTLTEPAGLSVRIQQGAFHCDLHRQTCCTCSCPMDPWHMVAS